MHALHKRRGGEGESRGSRKRVLTESAGWLQQMFCGKWLWVVEAARNLSGGCGRDRCETGWWQQNDLWKVIVSYEGCKKFRWEVAGADSIAHSANIKWFHGNTSIDHQMHVAHLHLECALHCHRRTESSSLANHVTAVSHLVTLIATTQSRERAPEQKC